MATFMNFHEREKTVKVWGPERYRIATILVDFFILELGVDRPGFPMSRLLKMLPKEMRGPKQYWQEGSFSIIRFRHRFREWLLREGKKGQMTFTDEDGDTKTTFALYLVLNTAFVHGSDSMRLLARLHGQCELNAFIEGRNRFWIAKKIESAVSRNLLYSRVGAIDTGWSNVIDFLKASPDAPVVLSYSGTGGLPNTSVCDVSADESYAELDHGSRWFRSMRYVRGRNDKLEWKKKNWDTMRVGVGYDVTNIARSLESAAVA